MTNNEYASSDPWTISVWMTNQSAQDLNGMEWNEKLIYCSNTY